MTFNFVIDLGLWALFLVIAFWCMALGIAHSLDRFMAWRLRRRAERIARVFGGAQRNYLGRDQ